MRISKIGSYENPYSVTGTIKLTGEKEKPKTVCTDKNDGTWKAAHAEDFDPMKHEL